VQAHFFTHHPSEILVNETFKREAWEVLKQLLKLLSIFTPRTLHEYMDLIILKNLPLIPFFRSLYNNAEWMTKSNAFLRSTKQAYIFPDFW
jgi:hypothetical protein